MSVDSFICRRTYYSLFPKKNGVPILNQSMKRRTNLLFAMSNFEYWIDMLMNETIKFKQFLLFIAILHNLEESAKKNIKDEVVLLLDNEALHHAKLTK